MSADDAGHEPYEISPGFRAAFEKRIARLEQDAARDEAWVEQIETPDHIRRHMRLVAIQRTEALRMRLFLDRTTTRPARTPSSPLRPGH